jgi:hypothetical protein
LALDNLELHALDLVVKEAVEGHLGKTWRRRYEGRKYRKRNIMPVGREYGRRRWCEGLLWRQRRGSILYKLSKKVR